MSFLNKLHKPNIEKLQANCDIPGLLEALNYRIDDNDSDASLVRQKAAAALGEIGDVSVVEPLIAKLQGTDWEVRDFAANALGQIGDRRAIEPLVAALKDRDRIVGEAAAQALDRLSWQPTTDETSATYWRLKRNWQKCGEIGAPAVSVLVAAVNGRDKEIGREALNALGKISDPQAVETLLLLLDDSNANLRQAAIEALGRIGAPAVEALLARLKAHDRDTPQRVVEVICQIGDPAIEPLKAGLKDSDVVVRQTTVKVLEKLHWRPTNNETGAIYWRVKGNWQRYVDIGAPAVELLITDLNDSDGDVRQMAAQALGKIGDARAVEALLVALNDSATDVRLAAVEALGQIGDVRAVEPLLVAVKDNDLVMCLAAVGALGRIGDRRAVNELLEVLNDTDSDIRLRLVAVEALGQIGDKRAIDPLLVCMKDGEKEIKWAAVKAIEKMRWEPTNDETSANYWLVNENWQKCVEIGAPAVEAVLAALMDNDKHVRKAAARALGQIGEIRAVEPLLAALKDDDADVRNAASEALGKIGDTVAIAPLISCLKDEDKDVRLAAAEALEKLEWKPTNDETGAIYWRVKGNWQKSIEIETPTLETLLINLHGSDAIVRQATVEALYQIGDSRAIGGLIDALEDKDRDVREAAKVALGLIGAPAVQPLIARLNASQPETFVSALVMIGAPAVEPVLAALRNIRPDACRTAAQALEQLGWKPTFDETSARYWCIKRDWQKCIQIGAPAVAPLMETWATATMDHDLDVRYAARDALEMLGAPAVEPLIVALHNSDLDLDARYTLERIGAPAVDALIAALQDSIWYVRRDAVVTLGKIGDARAVAPLMNTLLYRDTSDMHKEVYTAIDKLGWKPGQDEISVYYWLGKGNVQNCVAIGPRAVKPLLVALKAENLEMRRDAAAALDKLRRMPTDDETAAYYWRIKENWQKCVEIGAPAVELLIVDLNNGSWDVRRNAAQALVQIYQKRSLPRIMPRPNIKSSQ